MLSDVGISDYITMVEGNGSLKDVITPSAIFKLFSKYPDKCRKQLGMHAGDLFDFWSNLLSSPEGIELQKCHPHQQGKTAHDLRHTVCLNLHEDAGPYAKGKPTNIISWGSLTGDGRDFEQRFGFGAFVSKGIAGVGEAWQGWELMLEDLELLKDGRDENGDSFILMDGIAWCGIMVFGFADLEQVYTPSPVYIGSTHPPVFSIFIGLIIIIIHSHFGPSLTSLYSSFSVPP